MARKLPWVKWFFGDWRNDAGVRSVSLAARGLWIDMLSLMDDSPRRGYLLTASGKPMSAEQLARNTGSSTDEVSRLLQELADSGVSSSTDDGCIYSRRMVRDEHISQVRSDAGRKGGNPVCLTKSASKTQANGKQTRGSPPSKPSVICSSSIQDSSSEGLRLPFQSEGFICAWNDWVKYRQERKLGAWKPMTMKARFAEFIQWGEANAIQAIRTSISQGWAGIFEPKGGGKASATDGVDQWLKSQGVG